MLRLNVDATQDEIATQRILNVLSYGKTSGTAYSAKNFPAGYHELRVGQRIIHGQRKPEARLQLIPIDFDGKTLLDIGCNQGGMSFALAERLKWGVGVDADYRLINACNVIRDVLHISNLSFYVFDIDKDPHDLLIDLLPSPKVDVVFLLSVCMWVRRWRQLIDFCKEISCEMVFETNGSVRQQEEQLAYLRQRYNSVEVLAGCSEDDPGQKKRKLVLAR